MFRDKYAGYYCIRNGFSVWFLKSFTVTNYDYYSNVPLFGGGRPQTNDCLEQLAHSWSFVAKGSRTHVVRG